MTGRSRRRPVFACEPSIARCRCIGLGSLANAGSRGQPMPTSPGAETRMWNLQEQAEIDRLWRGRDRARTMRARVFSRQRTDVAISGFFGNSVSQKLLRKAMLFMEEVPRDHWRQPRVGLVLVRAAASSKESNSSTTSRDTAFQAARVTSPAPAHAAALRIEGLP
jgi:hypothetical protein